MSSSRRRCSARPRYSSRKRGEIMEQYLCAKDVADALKCSSKTAYDVIHSMPCLKRPLRVSERIFKRWLEDHTVYPMPAKRR